MASKTPKISSIDDVTCPICLLILIEPVTLPCNHELCLSCFDINVNDGESSLVCPMCRMRIGSWARKAKRSGNIVNQKRWAAIQEKFPTKVQHRLNPGDASSDSEDEICVPFHHIAEPGEIRKEYETELERLNAEREVERKAEEEASLKLIEELKTKEKHKSDLQTSKMFKKPKGALDSFVKRTPKPAHEPQNTATPANNRRDSYPYFCYTPSSTGKLITADMVTKDSYPYVELPSKPSNRGKNVAVSTPYSALVNSAQKSKSVSKATSTTTLADLARMKQEPASGNVQFKLSPSELEGNAQVRSNVTFSVVSVSKTSNVASASRVQSKATSESRNSIRNWLLELPGPEPLRERSRSPSEESKDSISKELNYFRPVKPFPRTPTKTQPIVTPVVKKQSQFLEPVNLSKLGGSPLLRQRMHEVQQEHHKMIESQSKATLASEEEQVDVAASCNMDCEGMTLLDLCKKTGALECITKSDAPPRSPPPLPMLPDMDEDIVPQKASSPPPRKLHPVAIDFHSELTRSDAACMPTDSGIVPHDDGVVASGISVHQWLQTHCNVSVSEEKESNDPVVVDVTHTNDTTAESDSVFNISHTTGEDTRGVLTSSPVSNTELQVLSHNENSQSLSSKDVIVLTSSPSQEESKSNDSGTAMDLSKKNRRVQLEHMSPIIEHPRLIAKPPPGPSAWKQKMVSNGSHQTDKLARPDPARKLMLRSRTISMSSEASEAGSNVSHQDTNSTVEHHQSGKSGSKMQLARKFSLRSRTVSVSSEASDINDRTLVNSPTKTPVKRPRNESAEENTKDEPPRKSRLRSSATTDSKVSPHKSNVHNGDIPAKLCRKSKTECPFADKLQKPLKKTAAKKGEKSPINGFLQSTSRSWSRSRTLTKVKSPVSKLKPSKRRDFRARKRKSVAMPVALSTRSHDKENPKGQQQSPIVLYCTTVPDNANPFHHCNKTYALDGLPQGFSKTSASSTLKEKTFCCGSNSASALDKCNSCRDLGSKWDKLEKYRSSLLGKDSCKTRIKRATKARRVMTLQKYQALQQDLKKPSEETHMADVDGCQCNSRLGNSCPGNVTIESKKIDRSDCDSTYSEVSSSQATEDAFRCTENDTSACSVDEDFLLAKKLQEDYDREHRLKLTALRHEKGENPYQFRRRKP